MRVAAVAAVVHAAAVAAAFDVVAVVDDDDFVVAVDDDSVADDVDYDDDESSRCAFLPGVDSLRVARRKTLPAAILFLIFRRRRRK